MYEIWLAPLRLVEIAGDQVVVEAPRELRAWVAERFARVLQASAIAVLGASAVVRVRAGDEGPRPRRRRGDVAGPTDVATGLGSVWVTNQGENSLSRVDPISGKVETTPIGGPAAAIAIDEPTETVWVVLAQVSKGGAG